MIVRTINLANALPYNNIRLRGIAQRFHKDWPDQVGLIGTTDPKSYMNDCLTLPPGTETHATACLATELARKFNVNVNDIKGPQARHKNRLTGKWSGGDVGVVVGPEWRLIGRAKEEKLGYSSCGPIRWKNWRKKLIEVVLEHTITKDILRFYSVYFHPGEKCLRTLQARRASQIIRDRAQAGDLPPIVVGDFNAGRHFDTGEAEESVRLMEQHFWRPISKRLDELLNEIEGLEAMPISPPAYKCQQIEDWEGWAAAQACWEAHQQSSEEKPRKIREWHEKHDEEVDSLLNQVGRYTGIDIIYIGKRSSFPKSKNVEIVPIKRHDVAMKTSCSVEGYPDFSYWLTDHDLAAGFRLKISPPGRIGPITSALVSALEDSHERVREAGAEALGEIGLTARDAVPALIKALSDDNVNVRRAAALALGKMGPNARDAIRALTEASHGEAATVRKAAAEALGNIGFLLQAAVSARTEAPPTTTTWSNWRSLCRPLRVDFRDLGVGENKDGHQQLFGTDGKGALWHTWQVAPNSPSWNQWIEFGESSTFSRGLRNIAVARNEDGRLELFAFAPFDLSTLRVSHVWQVLPNGYDYWSDWDSLLTAAVNDLAIGQNSDGRLELFVTYLDGALWHAWQVAPNAGWSGQESLGSPPGANLSDLAVARNEDGRLEVFALDGAGALWHIWQVVPNGGWNGWASLANPSNINFVDLAVAQDKDRHLQVFAIGAFGRLWHRWQVAPNGGWSAWENLGSGPTINIRLGAVTVAPSEDGRLAVFALGRGGAVWHKYQKTLVR